MCGQGLEPKYLMRDIEARVGTMARAPLQDHDKSPEIAPARLAALGHWWQRMKLRMLRKDVGHV
jgi:hypothetical protein